ncbi:MAG: hypothetical protein RIR00_1021 [Pseudomonadota bacterium]|jgi:hypothetical protein
METSSNPGATSGKTLIVGYQLDKKDRIIDVAGDWDRFALDNGAEELIHDAVIGCSLRSFVSGDITRMFLDTLLAKVRLSGEAISQSYRCDSPGVKRFMQMTVLPGDEPGGIATRHQLLREEVFERQLQWLDLRTGKNGGHRLLKRCSMCNRLSGNGRDFIEPENFLPEPAPAGYTLIYHVCPDCLQRVRGRR